MEEKRRINVTTKNRIRIRKREESGENEVDSVENSTENTRRRILPNRANRGSMMKFLQEKEAVDDDDFYNNFFAEKSSDEDFDPSNSEISVESEEASDGENEEKTEELKHADEFDDHSHKKISARKIQNEEDVLDIELLDLDKIDEIEDLKEKGDYESVLSDSEESEEFSGKKKRKKQNKNLLLVEDVTKKPKRAKRAFIDDLDEDSFTAKGKVNKYLKQKRERSKIKKKPKLRINANVVIKNNKDPDIILIRKRIFDEPDEEQEEVLEYNDRFYTEKQNMKNQEEETKKIIKKFKKPTDSLSQPVRYSFMQEKLSQKDLLLEAIFTEFYNIQSLQEMQRLDDLNKKEAPSQGRRQFAEYVRIRKGEREVKTESDEFQPVIIKQENIVTFSNPLVYEKIFENFNKKPEIKEAKICVVTGNPAKYLDPLTKQYYYDVESFKLLRERYFQKEEDSLLFRIQTLSDMASQKKEKIKKFILSNENNSITPNASKNLLNMINKFGILRNEGEDTDKKVVSHRIYNRNRENCVNSGMLKEATIERLVISKKIFRDKYSNRAYANDPNVQI